MVHESLNESQTFKDSGSFLGFWSGNKIYFNRKNVRYEWNVDKSIRGICRIIINTNRGKAWFDDAQNWDSSTFTDDVVNETQIKVVYVINENTFRSKFLWVKYNWKHTEESEEEIKRYLNLGDDDTIINITKIEQ